MTPMAEDAPVGGDAPGKKFPKWRESVALQWRRESVASQERRESAAAQECDRIQPWPFDSMTRPSDSVTRPSASVTQPSDSVTWPSRVEAQSPPPIYY